MHFIVSWDITHGPLRNSIEQRLLDVLSPYPHARPLTTFYIVQVSSQNAYLYIVNTLTGIAQQYPQLVRFVVGPLISGGNYNGWLDANLWPGIQSLTT